MGNDLTEVLETMKYSVGVSICEGLFLTQVNELFWPKLSEGSVGHPLVYTIQNDAMTCCSLNKIL